MLTRGSLYSMLTKSVSIFFFCLLISLTTWCNLQILELSGEIKIPDYLPLTECLKSVTLKVRARMMITNPTGMIQCQYQCMFYCTYDAIQVNFGQFSNLSVKELSIWIISSIIKLNIFPKFE